MQEFNFFEAIKLFWPVLVTSFFRVIKSSSFSNKDKDSFSNKVTFVHSSHCGASHASHVIHVAVDTVPSALRPQAALSEMLQGATRRRLPCTPIRRRTRGQRHRASAPARFVHSRWPRRWRKACVAEGMDGPGWLRHIDILWSCMAPVAVR